MNKHEHVKKHIIIVGAGFGGLAAALELERKRPRDGGYNVTVIDQNCYHLYHALLYEVATAPMDIQPSELGDLERGVCIRIKALKNIFLKKQVTVQQGTVVRIELGNHLVHLSDGQALMFDYLILALGSEPNYFGIPGLAEHSVPLKTLPDALTIHERCAVLIHRAMHEGTPSKIVVAGAGVAGVETASQLRFYLNHRLPHSGQAAGLVTVELIEGAPMILPGMETWVQEAAVARLQALGVEIKTGLTIAKVDRQGIELRNGQRRNYDLLMWCGGIKAHHLLPALNVACSGKGQVCVEADLTIPGHPHVSVVGDGAAFVNPATGQPLPQVATVAVSQGRVAANNILAHMSGAPSRAYQPVEAGYVFPVGGRWAISTIGHRRTGFSAWWVRKKVDLLYYLSILRWRHALEVFWHGGQVYLRKD